ncbi:MAG TPA: hypothetical protein VE174_01730 [Actinomycetota bacterium]|nr:hypothetical protein [Actinomycetota bacterium]
MKKIITVALTIGLLAGSLAMPAEAGKKKKKKAPAPAPVVRVERTVEWDYVCPCPGTYQFGSATGTNFGGGPLPIGSEERFVSITAVDQSGQPVLVSINQDTNGDGFNDGVADVCATGEKGEAAEVSPGLEMRLFISTGPCGDGASVPLGGTLTVTLSNLP